MDLRVRPIYLDHNATAPLRPVARDAMVAVLDHAGNPSAVHGPGRAARAQVEAARVAVAKLTGTPARSLIFTGGGTEAANLALSPTLARAGHPGCDVLLVGAGEHPCVLSGHRFAASQVVEVPLTPDGVLDLAALTTLLAQHAAARPMLAVQAANNETGVLQPVTEAARLIHAAGGLVVCDAVQMAGRLPLQPALAGADVLLVSAHKMGGPQGVGAVALAHEDIHIAQPHQRGGGQERGQRAGTENVAAIAAFGATAAAILPDLETEAARQRALRDQIEARLKDAFPDLIIFGHHAPRLPNTLAVSLSGLSAETMLMALDMAGVALSSGSACSSGKVRPSHVLAAMGVPEGLARGALRISLGWDTTPEDANRFCDIFQKTIRSVAERRRRAVA